MRDARLIALARKARQRAYAPYSRFRVGAALLGATGRVFTGCNVENASYGLTVCAERNALFQAVAAGERRFRALAVVGRSEQPLRSCGACLQVLAEFAPNLRVLLVNGTKVETFTVAELLPQRFRLNRRRR